MRGNLTDWRRVLERPSLVEAAAAVDPGDVAAVSRLRRDHEAELVAIALDLASARRKAARKWPDRDVVADPEGVEMATSTLAGAHKAGRFAGAGGQVIDICSGVGGDAMALADAGVDVVGVDRSEVRAWMCAQNARCATRVQDAAEVEVGALYHLDPSRRAQGRRMWRYEELSPGPDVIESLAAHDGAVKLGPGVELERLPRGEVELISEHGTLTQCVLWTGGLASVERRATVLPAGESIEGVAGVAPVGLTGQYVYSVDASVERAGLLGELCARHGVAALHERVGILTGDALIESPFVTAFTLIERMAWRPRHVKAWLEVHDAGVVEVKTRGKVVDPDIVQRELRGAGSRKFTVFVLRFGAQVDALMTERV